MAIALGLITFVAVLTYMGRDGYIDPEDDSVSVLDAFYYSTVTITTTGYGDIRPITDSARLVTTVLVTPARVVFLILLVGPRSSSSRSAAGRPTDGQDGGRT